MSGSPTRLTVAWPMVPEEPGQVFRLQAFRTAHPEVIIGKGEFGTWQARILHLSGETVTIRHTLRALLDRLGELLAEPDGCPPGANPDKPPVE